MSRTITALQVQTHDQERVSVFLDGDYAFSLDLMSAAQLRRGQTLTDEEITLLTTRDEEVRTYLSAIRYVGVRPRSEAELERHLRQKKYSDAAIAAALTRLQAEQLVDDAEFARYWRESRDQFRPRSSRALRFELLQKGVDRAAIDDALAGLDEDEAAWMALQPKLERWRSLPEQEFTAKASGFLARRGFSFEVVRRVLRRVREEE